MFTVALEAITYTRENRCFINWMLLSYSKGGGTLKDTYNESFYT